MHWQPTPDETEAKLIEMAYVWGDIEERLEREPKEGMESDDRAQIERGWTPDFVAQAFRVEAIHTENGFGDPVSAYRVLFDVADEGGRNAARALGADSSCRRLLQEMIRDYAQPWHSRDNLFVEAVRRATPVQGQVCRRLGQEHPPQNEPMLDDLPEEQAPQAEIGFEKRDVYWLTPIEAKFYDAARESALFFAVQPWIQGTDRRYRLDFLFFYDGMPHGVELDGHEWHKTREQRSRDAERERWFEAHKIRVHRFTGSQVHADPQGCVSELLDLLRGAASRP